MTEKRFEYYEHKGADYILDTPNKSLDFIEMLGDCLEAEKIVDLLNKLNDENEQLKHDATVLIQANQDYRRENEQLKHECNYLQNRLDDFIYVQKENEQLKKELSEYKDFVLSDDKILCYTCLFCTHKGIYEVDCDVKGHVDVHGICHSYTKKEVKE